MSTHYPSIDAPEDVRALAFELWSDLRSTPAGFARSRWPAVVDGRASTEEIDAAILWLFDIGAPLRKGSRRFTATDADWHYPAHALARVDLLDELRARLGSDADPLAAIEAMKRPAWVKLTGLARSWTKRDGELVWCLTHMAQRFALHVMVRDEPSLSSEVACLYLASPDAGVLAYADYLISARGRRVREDLGLAGRAA